MTDKELEKQLRKEQRADMRKLTVKMNKEVFDEIEKNSIIAWTTSKSFLKSIYVKTDVVNVQ